MVQLRRARVGLGSRNRNFALTTVTRTEGIIPHLLGSFIVYESSFN